MITFRWQSHTHNSEGCSRAGIALAVGVLCVVPSFVLPFALLLCLLCLI